MTINAKHSQQGQVVHFSKIHPFCLMKVAIYHSRMKWLSSLLAAVIHEKSLILGLSEYTQTTIMQPCTVKILTQAMVSFQWNTSECVYSTLRSTQTKDSFVKFLWQDVSNLFSSIQHFLLNWISSLRFHTALSSEDLSAAITICLSQARTLCKEVGQTHTKHNLTGDWAPHPWKDQTICHNGQSLHWSRAEAEEKFAELRETWPLMVAASNGVRYWLQAVQCLLFLCPCSLS